MVAMKRVKGSSNFWKRKRKEERERGNGNGNGGIRIRIIIITDEQEHQVLFSSTSPLLSSSSSSSLGFHFPTLHRVILILLASTALFLRFVRYPNSLSLSRIELWFAFNSLRYVKFGFLCHCRRLSLSNFVGFGLFFSFFNFILWVRLVRNS